MKTEKSSRKTSIKLKFLVFSVIFFLLILAGGGIAFFLSMQQLVHSNAAQELSRLLETKRIPLEASVNAEIAIALKMADSPLLKQYFLQPEDPDLERLALEEIAGYRRAFAGNTVFWVNDIDKRFYSDDAYSYTVNPADSADYWYNMTLQETEVFNFNINYNDNLKKTMLWINAPVFENGAPGGARRPIGMVGTGIDLTGFINSIYSGFDTNAVSLYLFNEAGEITGAQDSGLIVNKELITKYLENNGGAIVDAAKTLGETEIKTFGNRQSEAAVIRVPQLGWYMTAVLPFSLSMYFNSPMTGIFFAMLAVILLVFIISNFFISSILKPLKLTMQVLEGISSDWDLTRRLDIQNRDEIGDLAGFFNMTFEKMKDLITAIKQRMASLSNTGSELAANTVETATAINQITSNIQSLKGRVLNQSTAVTETGESMERIMANVDNLNKHIAIQADNVSQSSSAIEEMLVNIHSVVETLVKNTANIGSLAESSEIGRNDLQTVSTDIQEIARESEGLLEINAVMENIASQTNLLSMNAAIEAAHAGEAGKGFAVVADEIRKLAESSSEQSKTIGGILKKIKTSIDTITQSTQVVLERFETMEDEVKTVSEQESGIRASMEEQEARSNYILDMVMRLRKITDQVKEESTSMNEESGMVIQQSKNLGKITSEVADGMDEMATGTEQINTAVVRVNEISGENKNDIDTLAEEISRFKVE
jgi:methyl-accepting chemotaxis protein